MIDNTTNICMKESIIVSDNLETDEESFHFIVMWYTWTQKIPVPREQQNSRKFSEKTRTKLRKKEKLQS